MTYIKPNMGYEASVFKYYLHKATNEIRLSKELICNIGTSRTDYCREMVICRLSERLEKILYNEKGKNRYIPIPLASIKHNGRTLTTNGTIRIHFSDINYMKYIQSGDNESRFVRILDTILGIIGVCLSHGNEERERRRICGIAGDYNISTNDSMSDFIDYKTLSSFWLISPVLVSLIFGIARSCLYVDVYHRNEVSSMLDKTNYREVKRIIDRVDFDGAKDIYEHILCPFFDKFGESDITLSYKSQRKVLHPLIDNGVQSVFKPQRMRWHWDKYDMGGGYGFSKFCSYINHPNTKLKYENFRRL